MSNEINHAIETEPFFELFLFTSCKTNHLVNELTPVDTPRLLGKNFVNPALTSEGSLLKQPC